MPAVCFSEENFAFPPLHLADEEGLLLVGGRVTPQRVLEAYKKGIFPWYNEDDVPLWWSPDPRFILFPTELHISRSMQKMLRKNIFTFHFNKAFEEVITACAGIPRRDQDSTWITTEMKNVYTELYHLGFAVSAESWHEEELVGGMYGIRIGKVFFGESMFSRRTNASKFAFIHCVQQLAAEGVQLIDCQVHTPHVATLGARLIPRKDFIVLLNRLCR
jgi:leucyl/phenylalanyl-tRNA--protein transferase